MVALQGLSDSAVARRIGVTQQAVTRYVNQPETQGLIASFMAEHHDSVKALIPDAIAAAKDSLARKQKIPDRLGGIRELGRILGWCEGRTSDSQASAPAAAGRTTLEGLLVAWREVREAQPAPPAEQAQVVDVEPLAEGSD